MGNLSFFLDDMANRASLIAYARQAVLVGVLRFEVVGGGGGSEQWSACSAPATEGSIIA